MAPRAGAAAISAERLDRGGGPLPALPSCAAPNRAAGGNMDRIPTTTTRTTAAAARSVLALVLAVALSALPAHAARYFAAPGFERVAHRDGVTVYRHRDAARVHVAAEAEFDAPPEAALAVLLAFRRQVGVVPHLADARVLE